MKLGTPPSAELEPEARLRLLASELVEGEQYALELPDQGEYVRATVVAKPSRANGKVEVRVDRPGRGSLELEVPCSRIRCTWRAYRSETVELISTAAFHDVAWLPEEGLEVERDDAPGRWTVVAVNLAEGWVEIRGELISMAREEVVPLDRVHPTMPAPQPTAEEIDAWLRRRGLGAFEKPVDAGPERVAPRSGPVSEAHSVDPRDIRPAAIAKRLLFTPEACDQYREQVEPHCPLGDEEAWMREHIAKRAKARTLPKGNCRRGEFIRFVVERRFAVVLYAEPQALPQEIEVDRLVILKPKPKGRQGGRRNAGRKGNQPRRRRPQKPRNRRNRGGGRK